MDGDGLVAVFQMRAVLKTSSHRAQARVVLTC